MEEKKNHGSFVENGIQMEAYSLPFVGEEINIFHRLVFCLPTILFEK